MCSSSSEPISPCRYLFGSEAESIFTNVKIANIAEKRLFIDRCLELSMKINVHLLAKMNSFFLIDPVTMTNQCHLYSLRTAQIMRTYHKKSGVERLARTEENRFLHLSLFLNYALIKDTNIFIKATKKALKEMREDGLSKKGFEAFLRDEGKYREKEARKNLNDLFFNYTKGLFEEKLEDPLMVELSSLSREDLSLSALGAIAHISKSSKQEEFQTFPKLAGVAYFVNAIAEEKIPFVVKVKVMTKEGCAGTIIKGNFHPESEDPTIIFEAIATDGSMKFQDCRRIAQECPRYFYRHLEKLKRHREGEDCQFCRKISIDLTPFRERIDTVLASRDGTFLYPLATDFMLKFQPAFTKFFEDTEHYPLLSKLFQEAIPKIAELGVGMDYPTAFSICHVHVDTASRAYSEEMGIESTPEDLLKSRGIL